MEQKTNGVINLISWIGLKLRYNKDAIVTVIGEDNTHVLIEFSHGTKIATPKSGFSTNDIINYSNGSTNL